MYSLEYIEDVFEPRTMQMVAGSFAAVERSMLDRLLGAAEQSAARCVCAACHAELAAMPFSFQSRYDAKFQSDLLEGRGVSRELSLAEIFQLGYTGGQKFYSQPSGWMCFPPWAGSENPSTMWPIVLAPMGRRWNYY